MAGAPYVNKPEFEAASVIMQSAARISRMRALADAGNVQAAWWYGNLLMNGGWDTTRMEIDFLRNKVLPETPDPRQDPYLIVPRDQYAAVAYHKIAASYPDDKLCTEISFSRGILAFCRTKTDIGYYGNGQLDRFQVAFFEAMEKNADPKDRQANPFIPFPFKRPEIENPKTKMFTHIANSVYRRTILQLCLSGFYEVLFSFILGDMYPTDWILNLLSFNGLYFVVNMVPLFWTLFIASFYGMKRSMPICSCALARKAHKDSIDQLPPDCRMGDKDPFETTPFFVRNSLTLMYALFVAYLFISFVSVYFSIVELDSKKERSMFVFNIFAVSMLTILNSFLNLVIGKTCCYADRDCEAELKTISG